MFKLLKKKSYMWIGGFLLISMALTFFVVYHTYSSMLTKDFIKKQKFLATQTSRILSEYMLSIEEQTDLIINKNHLGKSLMSNNQQLLNRINYDNVDFTAIEIYSEETLVITTLDEVTKAHNLTPGKIKNILGASDSCWYVLGSNNSLIYIREISSDSDTAGYLAAHVNSSSLKKILSINDNSYSSDEKKLFASYSNAGILVSGKLCTIGKSSKNISVSSAKDINNEKLSGRSYLFKYKLGNDDMTLLLEEDISYFRNYLSFIKKILFTIYIALALLIVVFLRYFTLKIDSTINSLYQKMMLDSKEKSE